MPAHGRQTPRTRRHHRREERGVTGPASIRGLLRVILPLYASHLRSVSRPAGGSMARTRRTPADAGEKIAARRRFLKVIHAAVAAGIAAPALAQQDPPRIARETLDCAEKIFGVDFSEQEEQ